MNRLPTIIVHGGSLYPEMLVQAWAGNGELVWDGWVALDDPARLAQIIADDLGIEDYVFKFREA